MGIVRYTLSSLWTSVSCWQTLWICVIEISFIASGRSWSWCFNFCMLISVWYFLTISGKGHIHPILYFTLHHSHNTLYSHNYELEGGEEAEEPLEAHHYGCRILASTYTYRGYTYSGNLWMDSVEVRFCGQGGYFSPRDPRYSIAFKDNSGESSGNYVRRCSIHHGYNTAIGIHTSNGVEVSQNVIWRTTDSSLKAGGNGNEIRNNLAMMTSTVQPNR